MGCLFFDVVVAGTITDNGVSPTQPWQYGLAVVLVVGLVFLEFMGFQRLWPPEVVPD